VLCTHGLSRGRIEILSYPCTYASNSSYSSHSSTCIPALPSIPSYLPLPSLRSCVQAMQLGADAAGALDACSSIDNRMFCRWVARFRPFEVLHDGTPQGRTGWDGWERGLVWLGPVILDCAASRLVWAGCHPSFYVFFVCVGHDRIAEAEQQGQEQQPHGGKQQQQQQQSPPPEEEGTEQQQQEQLRVETDTVTPLAQSSRLPHPITHHHVQA